MKYLGIVMLVGLAFFSSCNKDEEATSGKATVKISITDLPGDYAHIYLQVKEVSVRSGGDWVNTVLSQTDTFDVLAYNNGEQLLIATASLDPGTTDEIRLVLSDTNTLVLMDGSVHDLKVPSGSSSGLKIKLDEATNVQANETYYVVLDFDANKSIVEKGNGDYSLKPVIRGYWDKGNGEVEGYALSTNSQVYVAAINSGDTIGSTTADANGYYKVVGLPGATYSMWYESTNGLDSMVNSVVVVQNAITLVDTVDLN